MTLYEIVVAGIFLSVYAWTIYNTPTMVAGLSKLIREKEPPGRPTFKFPFFSIIVAAKNEAAVIGRLLDRLALLKYDGSYEVVVVEDGSHDQTKTICEQHSIGYPEKIRFFHRDTSTGKPAALNYGAAAAKGDVLVVLDADNVPEIDFLQKAAGHFADQNIAAVQGMTCSINRDQNLMTKMGAYEDEGWFKIYMRGKDALGLFVPLTGSCGFVRRDVLRKIGGWDEGSIAEDVELAARLVKEGHTIRYAPEVRTWQETASTVSGVARQKTRWFRGYMETLAKYGSLLTQPSKINLDAEVTLFGPVVLNVILASYLTSLYGFIYHPSILTGELPIILAVAASILTGVVLGVCGISLVYHARPRRVRNIIWIPAVYLYWFFQTFLATKALLLFLSGRPHTWTQTVKSGTVTVNLQSSEKR